MFMMSVRLTRKRMLFGALAFVLIISAVIGFRHFSKEDAVFAANPGTKDVSEKVNTKKAPAKTNDDRIAFIRTFGWEVNAEPAEVLEVIIPEQFDDVYTAYNSIQKLQGCDLEPLAGKRCKRYSYEVTNYPGQTENVRVNLLVMNNKVIGGDVCSLELGGFMHGFIKE